MARQPVISIGMPVFNASRTLADSVASILQQDYTDWELLILDDGSTDGTAELARSFADPRIRVLADGRNRGLAARLNEAVGLSRGEYFARMDGDDIAYPQRLARQLEYLRQHPEVDLVGGWALIFDSEFSVRGRRMTPESHAAICAAPWSGFPLLHPTFMAKKAWFVRFPYDESLGKAQDQVLLAHACNAGRFANVQEIVLAYREDLPTLGKLWASRRCMLRGMFRAYMAQGRSAWAWRVVLAQGIRMLADLLASLPALRARQLGRRSVPMAAGDEQGWQALLSRLHDAGSPRA